jgi:hypothetical protein
MIYRYRTTIAFTFACWSMAAITYIAQHAGG